MQIYHMDTGNWYQYEKLFSHLRTNRLHTPQGMFKMVWNNPSEWITGETVIVTDEESYVGFFSEGQYFWRPHLEKEGVAGVYGIYLKPTQRGKGLASEITKIVSSVVLDKKVALLNNKVRHLGKHFQNAIIVP